MSSRGLIHHAFSRDFTRFVYILCLFHLLFSHPPHFLALSRIRASHPFFFLIFFCLLLYRSWRLLFPSLSPFSRSLLYLSWEKGMWLVGGLGWGWGGVGVGSGWGWREGETETERDHQPLPLYPPFPFPSPLPLYLTPLASQYKNSYKFHRLWKGSDIKSQPSIHRTDYCHPDPPKLYFLSGSHRKNLRVAPLLASRRVWMRAHNTYTHTHSHTSVSVGIRVVKRLIYEYKSRMCIYKSMCVQVNEGMYVCFHTL